MTATTRQTTRFSSSSTKMQATKKEDAGAFSIQSKKSKATASAKKTVTKAKSKITTNKSSTTSKETCQMAKGNGPWYRMFSKADTEYDRYMGTEWGFEKRGNVALFEKMSLEGAQAGLSWLTILRKREAYRRVFHGFDIDQVAAMTAKDVDRIVAEEPPPGGSTSEIVVRHRGKIESVISNARCVQQLLREHPDQPEYFDEFMWSFVDDRPILQGWNGDLKNATTQTAESQAMSKALKKLGCRFVGPTTMYALMQSLGMVIDHPIDSPEREAAKERLQRRPGGYQER